MAAAKENSANAAIAPALSQFHIKRRTKIGTEDFLW